MESQNAVFYADFKSVESVSKGHQKNYQQKSDGKMEFVNFHHYFSKDFKSVVIFCKFFHEFEFGIKLCVFYVHVNKKNDMNLALFGKCEAKGT